MESNLVFCNYQESLLQSYRKIQFTTQSIFILGGVYTTATLLDQLKPNWILLVIHGLLSLTAILFLLTFRKVIRSRARDVDYWHSKIIQAESKLDFSERSFTQFKMWQKHRIPFSKKEMKARYPKEKDLELLVRKEKGHTRKLLDDWLPWGFLSLWLAYLFGIALHFIA